MLVRASGDATALRRIDLRRQGPLQVFFAHGTADPQGPGEPAEAAATAEGRLEREETRQAFDQTDPSHLDGLTQARSPGLDDAPV